MLIRVTARAVLSIEWGGQFCEPRRTCMVLFVVLPITGAVPPFLVGPIIYPAAWPWRDSWQLIGEVKTMLGTRSLRSVLPLGLAKITQLFR